jgi:UDP-N-acetylglucosamine 2-epimerase (non-hydrolysing)/GDP/UDP-N,N'-diacetylbacillosamine 2-epimerase (hydrolysing)
VKRIIAVFTGNRAEYGLQYPVLKAIESNADLDYRLIVSGAHLDKDFGQTIQEIQKDGFTAHKIIEIDLDESKPNAISHAIGTGVLSISKALSEIKPDIFLIYADRFEGFAAVIASSQMNIPTAHIEGGDITEGGALDDSVRHAMTKLAHIHFTTNDQATNRILAMGEAEWRVHTVGFPAIDMIQDNNFATPSEISVKYSLDLARPIILFTQHSVTTEFEKADQQVLASIEALIELSQQEIQVVVTYPNNDAGGRAIIKEIHKNLDSHLGKNLQIHQSLGRYNYHGILALAQNKIYRVACVGNSSSGIKETPAFQCPTVNIGSRQQGRLRAENVIDANYNKEEIMLAAQRCFNDDQFINLCRNVINPYGKGDAGKKIASILSSVDISPQKILRKEMTIQGEIHLDGWFR